MSGQTHTADARILNQRTLEKDHRRLAALLQPGVSVLDVGCGTGAITAGIARVCGWAVGIDRDASLIAQARAVRAAVNLSFLVGDVLDFETEERFDIVNAARVLQWIHDPGFAVRRMAGWAKPGGMVMVLDYNHEENRLDPEPPREFARFYAAFLDWRAGHGWDNRMGDHLPGLFAAAGLAQITWTVEDEVTGTSLWPEVLQSLGPQMVAEGALSETERVNARTSLLEYCATELREQTLILRAVTGIR
jgi:SAM-dependent methyltransferase